ncbi:hypothetical protein NQZ68_013037 [Dissostichus eleginoides]|nr:hypothetical protein NQZ68_013037 [Dissostichus eleginoides]
MDGGPVSRNVDTENDGAMRKWSEPQTDGFVRCSPPLHCSSASSSPVEQLPYPPPSIAANESQRGLLGNCAAQPAQDSDSEDEFGPNSFLVKTGSGNLYAPATADEAKAYVHPPHLR